jgi:hypothetical protein
LVHPAHAGSCSLISCRVAVLRGSTHHNALDAGVFPWSLRAASPGRSSGRPCVLSGASIAGLVPLAAFGVLSLPVVVAIHEAAEVSAVGIAQRRAGEALAEPVVQAGATKYRLPYPP